MSVVVHPGRLRQEMARRGWSGRDLAREARLSEATIRMRRNPTPRMEPPIERTVFLACSHRSVPGPSLWHVVLVDRVCTRLSDPPLFVKRSCEGAYSSTDGRESLAAPTNAITSSSGSSASAAISESESPS